MYITQPGETRRYPERKENLYTKILEVIDEYPKCVFVDADHVGSLQFSKIRAALRGKAVMVMGKNTILRKAVRSQYENNPKLKTLVPLIQGNQGLIFTKGDLAEIKELCDKERVQAPAKAGVIAPVDVHVPKQNTGMSPTQTSFFQALNIPTKISKGAVEILQDVHLIAEGDKVSASQATLLEKLAIKPFYYGLEFRTVWEDGNTYPASILEVSEEHLLKRFTEAVTNVAHLSLGLSYPTVLSAPFLLSRAYYNVLAISCGTEYKIEAVEKMLEAAKNAPAQTATTTSDAPKAEEKKEEEEEEEDDDMGFSLFD